MSNKSLGAALNIIKEILELPEVQASRKALEGGKAVDIVKHALERQFLLGTLQEDFDIIKKDREND
jgi:hypothetical protein